MRPTILFSDELYHHGILGQKWGIRRYQNEDGSLTAEGAKRYGNSLGKYVNKNNGILRRVVSGDHPLGIKRYYDKKEERLKTKIQSKTERGKKVSEKLVRKYESIKLRNIERDKGNSYRSTGKMMVQNLLLDRPDVYRENRDLGYGRLKSGSRQKRRR